MSNNNQKAIAESNENNDMDEVGVGLLFAAKEPECSQ